MNRYFNLLQTHSHWLLSLCVGAWLGLQFQPAEARLKVTVTKSTNVGTPHSLGGSSPQNYLCCNGFKTYICRDENGKTQVYVNDDGGDFSTEEKYRVDIDDLGMDWTDFTIYAGKQATSGSLGRVEIKMVGGHVGRICLSGFGARAANRKSITYSGLYVTGGMIESIKVSELYETITVADIHLKGMKYAGRTLAASSSGVTAAYLTVSLDCEFYQPYARMTPTRCPNGWNIIMPDSATWTNLVAMGNRPEISDDDELTCPVLEDYSSEGIDFYGTLHLTSCNGWQSSRPISNYSSYVTIPEHKPISYLIEPATCTSAAQYKSYCSVCGVDIAPDFPTEALGHVEVADPEVSATCWRTGLTGGTHCARCGEVIQEATIVGKTEHVFTEITATEEQISAGCFLPDSEGNARFRRCSKCCYYEMLTGSEGSHDWKKIFNVNNSLPAQVRTYCNAVNRFPGCYLEGYRATDYCPICYSIKTNILPAEGHFFTQFEGQEPTCKTSGTITYKTCDECGYDFLPDASSNSLCNVDSRFFNRRALGHRYGVLPASNNPDAFISEATCTEPAKYWDVCAVCGEMSDEFTVTGSPAKGHKYHIQQIDYVSPEFPTDGDMTLECDRCEHTVSDLGFSFSARLGTPSLGYMDGYWCKSKLVETTTLPTCIDGAGIYEAVINYKGNRLSARYENFVPACGYLHNYGPDGVCHETHYQYKTDATTGLIEKDAFGCINYKIQNNEYVEDETVYSSNGYIAVPYETPRVHRSSMTNAKTTYTDPEDGTLLTYTDYRVTQFEEPADLLTLPDAQVEPFYLGIFDELRFDAVPDLIANPLMLDLDVHDAVTHFDLGDTDPYRAVTALPVSVLKYTRTYSNTNWKPLYVPFPMSVVDLEESGLQVARLNDTHMFDDDFNGTIDRVTLEFIRLTSGELLPNRPYMIRSLRPAQDKSCYFENIVMQPARETSIECSTVDQKITITGTYEGLPAGVLYDNNYYAMNLEGGLQRAATTSATLGPQRWYLKIENKDGSPMQESDYFAAEVRVLGASDDDEVTGITDLYQQPVATFPAVYRLDGTRVNASSPLRPSIYVSEGKRIVVR